VRPDLTNGKATGTSLALGINREGLFFFALVFWAPRPFCKSKEPCPDLPLATCLTFQHGWPEPESFYFPNQPNKYHVSKVRVRCSSENNGSQDWTTKRGRVEEDGERRQRQRKERPAQNEKKKWFSAFSLPSFLPEPWIRYMEWLGQEGPAVEHRELYSVRWDHLYGKRIGKRMDVCIYTAESLCCTAEIIPTLEINCTSINLLKVKKNNNNKKNSNPHRFHPHPPPS